MSGFLDQFRNKVIASVWRDSVSNPKQKEIDDKIALGVLLWIVAAADEKFLPLEKEKIKEILISYAKIPVKDIPCILQAIDEAQTQRIDMRSFTSLISKDLSYQSKINIIAILFSVACVDKELDIKEVETIRKAANLFNISHKDFIDVKIRVKQEFNLKTAD
ncbi:MAG: TerB family tellurite resistance protein [Candidatus Omnitrophota bacterium]